MSWPYANTELWDDLADKEISFKAIFLFRVITCNPLMSHSGLYKVSIAQLSLWTAMPRPEVASAIEELKNAMLIWYDNKVLFSPYIPEEQRYQSQDNLTRGRKRWRDIIQKARRMCIDTPSETGEENSAFAAFEQFHAELLFEIESLEEEKLQRNVKKAIAEETDTSRTLPPETGNPPPNIENPSRSVHESLPQNGGTLRNKEKGDRNNESNPMVFTRGAGKNFSQPEISSEILNGEADDGDKSLDEIIAEKERTNGHVGHAYGAGSLQTPPGYHYGGGENHDSG